jgi:hypothetical protein
MVGIFVLSGQTAPAAFVTKCLAAVCTFVPHIYKARQSAVYFSVNSVPVASVFRIGAHTDFTSHLLVSYAKQRK